MKEENTFDFLLSVMDDLVPLPVAAFGGWAEEILGLTPPKPHSDVDLLLSARDFTALEAVLATDDRYAEVTQKRFSHKRAYERNCVRIEVFIVDPETLCTTFFDGMVLRWPSDTFSHRMMFGGRLVHVASPAALELYRIEHSRIMQAWNAARDGASCSPTELRDVPEQEKK